MLLGSADVDEHNLLASFYTVDDVEKVEAGFREGTKGQREVDGVFATKERNSVSEVVVLVNVATKRIRSMRGWVVVGVEGGHRGVKVSTCRDGGGGEKRGHAEARVGDCGLDGYVEGRPEEGLGVRYPLRHGDSPVASLVDGHGRGEGGGAGWRSWVVGHGARDGSQVTVDCGGRGNSVVRDLLGDGVGGREGLVGFVTEREGDDLRLASRG